MTRLYQPLQWVVLMTRRTCLIRSSIETNSFPSVMAVITAPSPKNTPISSAWSRLVQLTKHASKTSYANTTELSQEPKHHAPSGTFSVAPVRPIRLRRPIALSERSDCVSQHSLFPTEDMPLSRNRDQDEEQGMTRSLSTDEADSIEVCSCLVGDVPLPDGKCSLSKQCGRKPKSRLPSSGPTKTVTLSDFWGTRTEERTSTAKHVDRNVAVMDVQSTMAEINERSSKESTHHADNETGTHALRKADLTPGSDGQTQDLSTRSQNTACVPSTSTDTSIGQPKRSTTIMDSPSKDDRFAAKLTAPTEQGIQSHNHDIALNRQSLVTLDTCRNSPEVLLQRSTSTKTIPGTVKINYKSKRLHARADAIHMPEPETTYLTTPSSSQESSPTSTNTSSPSSSSSAENENDEVTNNTSPTIEFKRKAKRRLTLHSDGRSGSGDGQPPSKKTKTKTQPKKRHTVQTTLSLAIGGSAGSMRECKACDTVYNPLHPEDVKVHTKRHAEVLKLRASLHSA